MACYVLFFWQKITIEWADISNEVAVCEENVPGGGGVVESLPYLSNEKRFDNIINITQRIKQNCFYELIGNEA